MATAATQAPKADAKLGGSGSSQRRTSGGPQLKGRRGSGVEKFDTHTHTWHTSTHAQKENPCASEEVLKEQYERFKKLFSLPAERLTSITDRFVETLQAGLQKEGNTVVSSTAASRL